MLDILKLIDEEKAKYTGKRFMGMPEEWMEPHPYWWCKNGHRSSTTLRRDSGPYRNVCLACFEPVWVGPKELPGVTPK
jgi:hypothetical protein